MSLKLGNSLCKHQNDTVEFESYIPSHSVIELA